MTRISIHNFAQLVRYLHNTILHQSSCNQIVIAISSSSPLYLNTQPQLRIMLGHAQAHQMQQQLRTQNTRGFLQFFVLTVVFTFFISVASVATTPSDLNIADASGSLNNKNGNDRGLLGNTHQLQGLKGIYYPQTRIKDDPATPPQHATIILGKNFKSLSLGHH